MSLDLTRCQRALVERATDRMRHHGSPEDAEARDGVSALPRPLLALGEAVCRGGAEAMRLSWGRDDFLGDVLNRTWRKSTLCYLPTAPAKQRNDFARRLPL